MLFTESIALCDGSSGTVISNLYCDIPMSTFMSSLGYSIGEDIEAKVQAINSKGYSPLSLVSSTLIAASAPTTYPQNFAVTATTNSVTLTFTPLVNGPDTGYSTITNYEVYSNNGSGITINFSEGTTSTSPMTITGLTTGSSYLFEIRAINALGNGPWSNQISTGIYTVPSQMSPLTITQTSTNAVLTWTAATNNGNGISAYKILLYNRGTNTYTEYAPLCDGSQTNVISALSCTIAISDFIANLNYQAGDLI